MIQSSVTFFMPYLEVTYPQKWHFEDDFLFPQVGYVNFLESNHPKQGTIAELPRNFSVHVDQNRPQDSDDDVPFRRRRKGRRRPNKERYREEESSRWWQLKYFLNFHPGNWGRWTHFDEHIFLKGLVQPPTSLPVQASWCFIFHYLYCTYIVYTYYIRIEFIWDSFLIIFVSVSFHLGMIWVQLLRRSTIPVSWILWGRFFNLSCTAKNSLIVSFLRDLPCFWDPPQLAFLQVVHLKYLKYFIHQPNVRKYPNPMC